MSRPVKLTKKDFLFCIKEGLSYREIAEAHNVSERRVQQVAAQLGSCFRKKSPVNKENLKTLLDSGLNCVEIATYLDREKNTIQKAVSKFKLRANWEKIKRKPGIEGERLFALARQEAENLNTSGFHSEFDFVDKEWGLIDVKVSKFYTGKRAFRWNTFNARHAVKSIMPDFYVLYAINQLGGNSFCLRVPGDLIHEVNRPTLYMTREMEPSENCYLSEYLDEQLTNAIDLQAAGISI